MKTKYLWMQVTPDEYELPIVVEETLKELSKKIGLSAKTIEHAVNENRICKHSGIKVVKVEI